MEKSTSTPSAARHVWRLMKRRSIGFSFAYMVTATATPMNTEPGSSPQRRSTTHAAMREEVRREMFDLLTAEPETKSVRPPVQIARFEC